MPGYYDNAIAKKTKLNVVDAIKPIIIAINR